MKLLALPKQNKKGFQALSSIIMTIVLVALVLGVGFMVLSEYQEQLDEGSTAYNATGEIVTALATMPGWITILIIVAIAGIVIAYLMGWFGGGRRRIGGA